MDYVFPYVDSSDPKWQNIYNNYCANHNIPSKTFGTESERFRDWGNLLRFHFRGIAKFLPWVENVFFIVQSMSQVPDWLDTTKVKVITHEQFIPSQYLPTFNSNTIETFLKDIPGLSEDFIYANDDMIPISPISKSQYINQKGLPKFHLALKKTVLKTSYFKELVQSMQNMILQDFPKTKIPTNRFYKPQHIPIPLNKTTMNKVLMKHNAEILAGITNFRGPQNINPYVYLFYQAFSGKYEDCEFNGKYFDFTTNTPEEIADAIIKQKLSYVCINDDGASDDSYLVWNAFQKILPQKCKFEKTDSEDTVPIEKTCKTKTLENYGFYIQNGKLYVCTDEEKMFRISYSKDRNPKWKAESSLYRKTFQGDELTELKSNIQQFKKEIEGNYDKAMRFVQDISKWKMIPTEYELFFEDFSVKYTDIGEILFKSNNTNLDWHNIEFIKDIIASYTNIEVFISKLSYLNIVD